MAEPIAVDPKLRELPTEEILRMLAGLVSEAPAGGLPLEVEAVRERAIDSPSYFTTEIVDPWYKQHFERSHYETMDEVLGPWCLGETVKIDGTSYSPKDYTGLLILKARGTIKSAMLRWLTAWYSLHMRLRLKREARIMFVHQVIDRATLHSAALREMAWGNERFRRHFPDFSPGKETRDWDTVKLWRWPGFTSKAATEWSYAFYGESSNKTGGHYTLRVIDDWVTEESVTNPEQLALSERRFRAMFSLRDHTLPVNPWIAVGTPYHFHDTYARLERSGGWLTWKTPAHRGSPKVIFDLAAIDDRTEGGKKRIRRGLRELNRNYRNLLNFPTILSWENLLEAARGTKAESGNLGNAFHEYSCQYLLDPVPEGEQRFDQVALDACWSETVPDPGECVGYLRCDPAISEKKKADDFAVSYALVDWRGHRWFVDGLEVHENKPTEQVRKMFAMIDRWKRRGYTTRNLGVESVAYQEALAQLCRGGVPVRDPEVDGEAVPVRKSPVPVVSIERSSDMRKVERIVQMTGPMERGEIHIWNGNPVGRSLYDGFRQFPYGKDHLLDTAHDMWIRAPAPPRPMGPQVERLHPALQKILKRSMLPGGERVLVGTHAAVPLTRWGGR